MNCLQNFPKLNMKHGCLVSVAVDSSFHSKSLQNHYKKISIMKCVQPKSFEFICFQFPRNKIKINCLTFVR